MIAYHGSNNLFDKFYLGPPRGALDLGLGVYFTDLVDVAETYGKYVYTVKIPDGPYIDRNDERTVPEGVIKQMILQRPGGLVNFGDVKHEGFKKVVDYAVSVYVDMNVRRFCCTFSHDFYRHRWEEFNKTIESLTGFIGIKTRNIICVWDHENVKILDRRQQYPFHIDRY